MATVTSTLPSYDRSIPSSSINFHTMDTRQNHGFFTDSTNPVAPRVTHCLDDMALLNLTRQYANVDLFEQSTLSNSTDDLSQIDRVPYQFDVFDQDQNDTDDYDLSYDDGNGYDYNTVIQDRLKKANEELEHDRTSSEIKHQQRVSFDVVVKAVDIVQDPNEYDDTNPLIRPSVSPVSEEPPANLNSPRSETSTHEYTVPLNDTQPKVGPTLLEQIKALQFHGTLPTIDTWATTTNNSSNQEDNSLKKSMVVSVNGQFDLKDEDDYTAKNSPKSTNDENNKVKFLPTPPTEPKQKQDSSHRPFLVRPKSSDSGKRNDTNSIKKNKTETMNRQRPKSAGVSKTIETYTDKPSSGVDFDELLRKAKEKRREELREERQKREEEEEKRKKELAKAKESYERWVQEKDAERKRINEEKRLEEEEFKARQTEQERELTELREKKYKEWIERKDQQAMIINEFKKLKADEEETPCEGSTSSISNCNRTGDHRAFQRWLRKKYEQSMEEKRELRLEEKRLRRRHRRSIKRKQLQQDLQLAKSFGYS